ncbi:hypothetical protein BH09PSE5_BH09PSE5_25890 [soil metagenome]
MASKHSAHPAKWSADVTENSDAMDLKGDVFKQSNPRTIARSLKASAERSKRRKSEPFRSAMSMLNFYINRAGRNLSRKQRGVLERAKTELRRAFHRPVAAR